MSARVDLDDLAEVYRLRAAIPVADAVWGRCQRED